MTEPSPKARIFKRVRRKLLRAGMSDPDANLNAYNAAQKKPRSRSRS